MQKKLIDNTVKIQQMLAFQDKIKHSFNLPGQEKKYGDAVGVGWRGDIKR